MYFYLFFFLTSVTICQTPIHFCFIQVWMQWNARIGSALLGTMNFLKNLVSQTNSHYYSYSNVLQATMIRLCTQEKCSKRWKLCTRRAQFRRTYVQQVLYAFGTHEDIFYKQLLIYILGHQLLTDFCKVLIYMQEFVNVFQT